MGKIEAVIFDMDGVLVDGEELWNEGRRLFLESRGAAIPDGFITETMGASLHDASATMKEKYQLKESIEEIITERKNIMMRLFKEKIMPLNGSAKTVQFAKKSGYKTAIGSSSPPELISIVVEKPGIMKHIDTIVSSEVSSEHVGIGKPDPAIFLECAKRLNVEPKNCIVIEDSPAGIKAAKAAGMKCIALRSHYIPEEKLKQADFIISDLKETEKIISRTILSVSR